MNAAVPIIMIGCEHNGGNEAINQPIAWPSHNPGTTPAGGIRTQNLSSNVARIIWLHLPPRTRVNSTGRVVIATTGTTSGGTLTLPDYQVYRCSSITIDQTNGNFTTSGSAVAISNLVTDVHTTVNWPTLPPLTTNIDLTADHSSQPLSWFSHLALRVRAPFSTGGNAAMYVTGLAVQNW